MSTLDEKIRSAEESINSVFSDRSVSQSGTARSLRELQGYIDIMLDTLSEDD